MAVLVSLVLVSALVVVVMLVVDVRVGQFPSLSGKLFTSAVIATELLNIPGICPLALRSRVGSVVVNCLTDASL